MTNEARRVWGAFVGLYAWYSVTFYNFANSPLRVLAEAGAGANPQTLMMLFHIGLAVSVLLAFFFIQDSALQGAWPVWHVLHALAFCALLAVPFITHKRVLYAIICLAGLLSGLLVYRVMYSGFFFLPQMGLNRTVAVMYIFINGFVHLFAIVPESANPGLMYTVSMALLLVGSVFSLSYRGSTLLKRVELPETKVSVRFMLPMVLLIVGVQLCFSAYKTLVSPAMPETTQTAIYQVIPNAVTLVLIYILGERIRQGVYLHIFLALMTSAFIAFQILGASGRNVVETFMQPAYLCWDVMLFTYLANLFHRYGKHQARLKSVLAMFFMALAVSESATQYALNAFLFGNIARFGWMYAAIAGMIMLIPQITRVLEAAGVANTAEALPDPPAQEPPVPALTLDQKLESALCHLLPPERLTPRETEVLRQLLDKQDTDVIGYLLGISLNTVRSHVKHICEKFGVKSRLELLALAGPADTLDRLSPRELEVLALVADALSDDEIAESLFISTTTVRTHIHNMTKKYGVGSRRELVQCYRGDIPSDGAPQGGDRPPPVAPPF